jgi:asparagine synthase (glutamine-hydrolysing)
VKDTALALRKKLTDSFKRNKASGLLFSGGLDSGVLAALRPDINAITVSLETFGEDINYSELIAKELNLKRIYRSVDIEEAIEAIPEVIRILKSFDPALPNDLVVYFGLKLAKEKRINEVATGDGSDEIFAGYSFMQEMDNFTEYIKRISEHMTFSSNDLGEFLNIKIVQPFIEKDIIDFSLGLDADLKIRRENGNVWGKWILRKAFEDMLPSDLIWQSKRPLEFGSGMTELRRIISERVSDEEFKENTSSVKFISKDHYCKICGYVLDWKA